MAYRGIGKKLLDKHSVDVGDEIVLHAKRCKYEGIVMPRTELGDEKHIVMKLVNGYNVGIKVDGSEKIEKKSAGKKAIGTFKAKKPAIDKKKPMMTILHTGGTIASRVDYRTGGVVSAFTPEEILELFPDLEKITNLRAFLVSNMFSEDIEMGHISSIARSIKKEIKAGSSGIVVTHGTDTMHYSSAALSFMARNLPFPVVLVGSQRSSDRGSSDAQMNLMCASRFAVKADFAGVGLCMHGSMEDTFCYIHEGTKVKKMHTSRRDTFRSINQDPYARIWEDGKTDWIRKDYEKRDMERVPVIKPGFEKKVALVKGYSGFHPDIIRFLAEKKFRGIVFEGTGLGHMPTNALDQHTMHHEETLKAIRDFNEAGGVSVMTSQCNYGRINMNVYSTGRDIQAAGVIPGQDMLPEIALVKLKWVLGQTKSPDEARKMMAANIAGEITDRTQANYYMRQLMRDDDGPAGL